MLLCQPIILFIHGIVVPENGILIMSSKICCFLQQQQKRSLFSFRSIHPNATFLEFRHEQGTEVPFQNQWCSDQHHQ